jgi:hypothetical protein
MGGPEPRIVAVAFARVVGWAQRYDKRHPGTSWTYTSDRVSATSPDGSSAAFDLPFPPLDEVSAAGLVAHLARPWRLGVVIVRKGGFAVAHLAGEQIVASKIGRRHVQSRTKAGGWSQQRFARRRENQAREAYDAASGYVHSILLAEAGSLDQLVTAGDRAAVDAVFAFRALTPLLSVPQRWLPGVPDPSRAVLDKTIATARSVDITVADTTG